MIKIAFTGNPNVGKSALINEIAGSSLKVGNWPGVTIEKKEATFKKEGQTIKLIDLPGVYSLSPYTLEEKITRDYIINENLDVVINVVDATNLNRNLYLTMLIKELGKPMLIALNFIDEFNKLNYKLDIDHFEEHMEIKTVATSAIKNIGIDTLIEEAIKISKAPKLQHHFKYELRFDKFLEKQIEKVSKFINKNDKFISVKKKYSLDFIVIKLLENDKYFVKELSKYGIGKLELVEKSREEIENKFDDDIETIFAGARYGAVKGILLHTLKTSIKSRLDFTDKIDKILLNKYLGIPIFLVLMGLLMGVVFNGSLPLQNWLDGFINGFVGKYAAILVQGTPNWLKSFVLDGLIGGVGGVLVFVPLMLFLYFFLAILEESGYMSRVAFLMDKIMRIMGLNGKAFVPMVLGFGCTVPAILSTRILEDEKSRRLTALMTPFMSCGARLPVYGLFTAAFFGKSAGLIIMSLYFLGIVVAILVGLMLRKNNYFKTDNKALLIELPPYRIPSIKLITRSAITRTGSYLKKATTVILGILIILWALTYFPNSGKTEDSYMAKFGKAITPIMKPTGFGDKWEAVAAILPSIAAKEVVVGFMSQVLSFKKIDDQPKKITNLKEDVIVQIKGLGIAVKNSLLSMIDIDVSNKSSDSDNGLNQYSNQNTLVNAISKLWEGDKEGPLKAYSFMVFILLVVPCVVALTAIKQEFGYKFMWFMISFLIIVPYIVSTLVFQIGRVFI